MTGPSESWPRSTSFDSKIINIIVTFLDSWLHWTKRRGPSRLRPEVFCFRFLKFLKVNFVRDFDQAEFFGENAEGQFGNSLDKNGYVFVPDKYDVRHQPETSKILPSQLCQRHGPVSSPSPPPRLYSGRDSLSRVMCLRISLDPGMDRRRLRSRDGSDSVGGQEQHCRDLPPGQSWYRVLGDYSIPADQS